jgi:hypothetical protein
MDSHIQACGLSAVKFDLKPRFVRSTTPKVLAHAFSGGQGRTRQEDEDDEAYYSDENEQKC